MEFFKKATSNYQIFKITFVNIKITFSLSNYKKSLKNYLTENFNINNWNLNTLIHFFPILLGFYQMISYRYKDQTFSYFFEKNIPAKKILKQEISWETFQFIKSKDLQIDKINKIDIYNDSIRLDIEKTNEKFFIGIFSDQKNDTKIKITPNIYKIFFQDFNGFSKTDKVKETLFFGEIFYKLDELPLKVEKTYDKVSTKNYFFDNQLVILNKKEKDILNKKVLKNTKKLILLPKNFQNFSSFANDYTVGVKYFSTNFQNNSIDSANLINGLSAENSLFQKEMNFLIDKIGISPLLDLTKKNQYPQQFVFKDYSPKQTLTILNEFLPLKKNNQLRAKKISGYYYPDIGSEEIFSLFLNNLLNSSKPNSIIQINLPSSFIYSLEKDSFFPSFFIKSAQITNRKDGFFGLNLEQDVLEKKENLRESNWTVSVLKEVSKKDTQTFEDLDDSDPDSWFLVYNPTEKTKAFYFEQNELNKFINEQIKNQTIFENELFQKQTLNKKVNFYYSPFTENLLNEKFYNYSHFGEIYKRIPNLSNFIQKNEISLKKNTFTFFECWEPISVYSWMLIIQFSVGLFLLQLLKDLYKDYGKELVDYVLQFASSSGIDVEEIKEQYLYDDPGYRLIKKVQKKFKDVAGIDNILPELGEIVWFLRNSGRSSKFQNTIPKGILLTGPPGTGKTLLVQAIAGEAQVPVIVESGSLLTDPQQKGRGIEKLKKIFEQARQLAPCIVFIDEVDTIGEKRQNIIQTAMGGDELIESIYENKNLEIDTKFIPQPLNLNETNAQEKDLEYELFRGESQNQLTPGEGQFQKNIEAKKTRLSLLTQFLVEMDGLKDRQGVIVIGATNRPTVLDPALVRPGRFDKILNLELPGKKKRIEILKLYSKKLKIEKNVSWDYLANRTKGFSAADLAAAMNESAIQSILNQTSHTIETIERGIDLVTSYSLTNHISREKKTSNDPFLLSRLAYYQAGKAILQTILPNHEPVVVLHLQPRQKNARHAKFYEKSLLTTKNRLVLEVQLIGLYSGKAAEILALYGNKKLYSVKRWQSDLGVEDLISATFLVNLMVDKWFLYSTNLVSRKFNQILQDRNSKEFRDSEKLELLNVFNNQVEDELEVEQIAKLSRINGYQQKGFGPWWQIQVSKQTSEIEYFFADWYRIYLPDPEESILNLEWLPPDEFYHNNQSLKKVSTTSVPSFNDLYKIERDYISHGLILNAFNKSFSILENKREFLDYFADYLLRYDILRQDQILFICRKKIVQNKTNKTPLNRNKIITQNWGGNSRRQNFRFIDFETLKFLKDLGHYSSPFKKFEKREMK